MDKKKNKPELLLPAGNVEAFYAAVEGGADAVYLGLRKFNARERADNFTLSQLQALLKEAEKFNVKAYLTLNTVIKNNELSELIDTLYALSQTKISAVIIQDWGVYHLIKNHFTNLNIHASTQMGNHNSLGATYAKKLGFERVIFARELTQKEIQTIRAKSDVEVEVFGHGALCYSFSGMCLFSSYLGGMSANRGNCMQPCRRLYQDGSDKRYIFSLKDNELIDFLPQIKSLGVASLKIEGRLKPAEYTYNVARAYRMAIDDSEKIKEAKQILNYDMGREKTSYFFGGNVKEAITENPTTGLFLGIVEETDNNSFSFSSQEELEKGNRIWVRSKKGKNRQSFKLKDFTFTGDNRVRLEAEQHQVTPGDEVYLANLRQKKFQNQFPQKGRTVQNQMLDIQKKSIYNSMVKPGKLNKEQIFLRIDSIKWLKKVPFQEIDNLIINFTEKEWEQLDTNAFIIKKNASKIFFELPKFIPENKIKFYKSLFYKFHQQGFRNFMISHLSQKLIIPKGATMATNENVYTFNDAAISHLREENIKLFTYPLENDMENLKAITDKKGIVPVYGYPELFLSRMPVHTEKPIIQDDKNFEFINTKRNGLTVVVPKTPVSFTQYKKQLTEMGYGRFLIDVSYEKPSDNRLSSIIRRLKQSEQIQPSSNFNMKMGLT
jgi:putative protease